MPGVTRSLRLYYSCLRGVPTYLSIYLRVGFILFRAGISRAVVSCRCLARQQQRTTKDYSPSSFFANIYLQSLLLSFFLQARLTHLTRVTPWPRLSLSEHVGTR
jgi:hypothetical protein